MILSVFLPGKIVAIPCLMTGDHVLTKSVPPSWQLRLDKWEVPLLAAGTSSGTIGPRLRHVRQLARGVRTSPEVVRDVETLRWFAERR